MALRATGWVAIALMMTALAACSSDDETDGGVQDSGFDAGPTDAGPTDAGEDGGMDAGEDGGVTGTAAIRVIHLSPDAPNVDVYNAADTTAPVVSDLAFPDTTPYLDVPEGTYTFDVVATGGDPASPVLEVPDVALSADTDYTVAAYDLVADLKALPLVDDNSTPSAGNLRFRAVHTAAGVGQVDIYDLSSGSPQLLFENLDFGSASDYAEVPAGDYTIGIDVNDDGTPDVRFQTGPLPAGISANVFAVSDGGAVFLIAQPQVGPAMRIDPVSEGDGGTPGTAAIRVIHLSPDAPNVDVYNAADTTTPVVSDLAFPDTTPYLDVPEGTYTFDVVAAGGDPTSPVLQVPDVALSADTDYTVAAYDLVADLKALPLVDDNSTPSTGNLRFRAVHTAAGVGQVDVYNIPMGGPEQLLFENLDFGAASDYVEVPAGDYTIGIDVNDDGTPDVRFRTGPLPAGISANVFAVSDGSGGVLLVAQPQMGATIEIPPTPMGDGGMGDGGM